MAVYLEKTLNFLDYVSTADCELAEDWLDENLSCDAEGKIIIPAACVAFTLMSVYIIKNGYKMATRGSGRPPRIDVIRSREGAEEGRKVVSQLDLSRRKLENLILNHFGSENEDFLNLISVNCSQNSIQAIEINFFVGFKNLKRLDLSHNELKVFPIESFKGLVFDSLNLSHNKIPELQIDKARSLLIGSYGVLNLSHNQIQRLPNFFNFSLFAYGSELDLSNNQLTELNPALVLEQLPDGQFNSRCNLQTLNLSNNQIKSISKEVLSVLKTIKSSSLENNPLEVSEA